MPATPYSIPPKEADPKPRYTRITDSVEIEAIKRAGWTDPIGHEYAGAWFAETGSLAQYRAYIASLNS